jgi:anthranilate phosphoribosyltransferase
MLLVLVESWVREPFFNLLGPLTNPAKATHQLVGVFDPALTPVMAEVLGELGVKAAYVVHGQGGLDELTTNGANQVSFVRNRATRTYEFDGRNFGLRPIPPDLLLGGSPEENTTIMLRILSGEDKSQRRDIVLLNSAMALATEFGDFEPALSAAEISLSSGAALSKLNELVAYSREIAGSTLIQ